jgi:CheY-like chemotaxis protein
MASGGWRGQTGARMTTPTPVIHVVDDDESLRTALLRLLDAAGFKARGYASVGDFLLQPPPDGPGCVLLDVRMPEMDGVQFLRQVAERAPDTIRLMLTGHADPPSDLREAFRPLDHAGAFAWRGVTAEDVMPAAPSPPRRRISRAAPMVPDTSDQPVTSQPASIDRTVLAEIRRLADAGELGVARLRAESLAAERTPDAALESLLGEIASAEGRLDEARGHWRRALYLDADHADALVHLTLLSESQGDSDAAAGYRRRLERLETDTEFES